MYAHPVPPRDDSVSSVFFPEDMKAYGDSVHCFLISDRNASKFLLHMSTPMMRIGLYQIKMGLFLEFETF